MDSHPVLRLLAQDEVPSHGSLRKTAIVVAESPRLLSDLAQEDLFDDLLSLLPNRTECFSKLLLMLSAQVSDKLSFSRLVTPFIQQLVRPAKELLDQSDYQGLLCAALQLCSANYERWKVIKEVASCGTTLEMLTASVEGHMFLLKWVLGFNEDSLDTIVLSEWTQRMVTLVESCSIDHGVSPALSRQQKLATLKQALRRAIEHEKTTVQISSSAQGSKKSRTKDPPFDQSTMQLFKEFGLSVPQSQRVCDNHLESLCHGGTLSILREILKSYPCRRCEESARNSSASPEIYRAPGDEFTAPEVLEESLFSTNGGIGEWKIVLSSRAYRNLQSYESDPRIRKAASDTLRDLAAGIAPSKVRQFKNGAPKIPLRFTKWRSNTLFLWQVDIAPGPGPDLEQQVIKVWAVGSGKSLQSMLDEIKKYQKSLPDLHVARCLEEGPSLLGRQRPKIYDQLGIAQDLPTHADLDVRFIDQEFIDTFNKSFTVTEHLLRAIVEGDLSAEFPFDVSQTELQIIQHTQTPVLIMGRSGTGKTTCLMFKMVAKRIAACNAPPRDQLRQALVTRSETLAEKLRKYSRSLVATLSQKEILSSSAFKPELSDQRTLLELEPSDFPLVCNYDQFLLMLETAVDSFGRRALGDISEKPTQTSSVDFKAFRHTYWPHFPLDLTKGLSPHLVFSDIMGVIKGSVHTCKTLIFLEAQEYQDLSIRVAPNVTSASDRVKVFRIFELYERLKHKAGELDGIDRVVRLLEKLREDTNLRTLLASHVHEFYIDEIQDLRCLDIELFLSLGNDPRSFNFGGDTAQGISQDSSFRFQDVKALFREHFSRQSINAGQKALADPQLFTLNRNYRSHQGILSLASSVMTLLWRNFPDIVDNLGPEVGSMAGPIPVLFLGCDASILLHNDSEDSSSPVHELLFGAEQVILTRDEDGKARLIRKIGETALVLTILQAKGMEFDDVILWDFFSSTPDPSGWRSLQHSSHEDSSTFDVVKHASICSELKHLYVAITRARVRFLMIEGSEEAPQPFVQLMTTKAVVPLLEVTSASSTNFNEKVKALQPRRSDDPQRWLENGEDMMLQGYYDDACVCFRRAKDRSREERAMAHRDEVRGIELKARGEASESNIKLTAAAIAFEELGLISDATRVLLRLDLPGEAAELWYKKKDFEKAAILFEKASNYKRASDSWHDNHEQSKAIACLYTGALYDQMVVYFANNKGRLSGPDVLRYQRSIKPLINRHKISEMYRGTAIGLLGSVAKQEEFYQQYGMTENLLKLYEEQQATAKLLHMLLKLDRLEEALELTLSLPLPNGKTEEKLLSRLQAVVWVDRITIGRSIPSTILVEKEHLGIWEYAFHILRIWDPSTCEKKIMSMESGSMVKAFLCFYATVNAEAVTPASKYNELPLDLLSQTVKLVKGQQADLHGSVGDAILLLCGVHYSFDSRQHHIMQSWSPLRRCQQLPQDENSVSMAALRWTTDRVCQAVVHLHALAKDLFRNKWPTRCNNFLATGRCNARNDSRGCKYLHEPVTSSSYTEYLEDLLKMNKILCEMTALYHQGFLSEKVSMSILGARRHWLEKLLAALTFISGFEQDSRALKAFTRRIRTEESMRVVASCLEDHLLYRARTEWAKDVSLGYVLEQLDSATHLGENVRCGLIRRTRQQLHFQNPPTHASMLLSEQFRIHLTSGNFAQYTKAFKAYTDGPSGIMKLDWYHFEAFHCHMSLFEGIALCLLLQVSQTSIVVPRSWLDLHLSDILSRNNLTGTSNSDQRIASRDALIVLLESITGLLGWLDMPQQFGNKFFVCGRPYSRIILHSRNWQLPALILCNLYSLFPQNVARNPWKATVRPCEVALVESRHFDYNLGNLGELQSRLVASHTRYHAKNPLVIVSVTDAHAHPFTTFQKLHRLENVKLSELRTRLAPARPSKDVLASDVDQLAQEERAALCIQKRWRKFLPLLNARVAWANTPRGRTVARLLAMAKCAGIKVRAILLSLGVNSLDQLSSLSSSFSELKNCALSRLEGADVWDSETLDTVLEGVGKMEEGLKLHYEQLADDVLELLTRLGDWQWLEELLKGQLEQMSREERELSRLLGIFNGMAKRSK